MRTWVKMQLFSRVGEGDRRDKSLRLSERNYER